MEAIVYIIFSRQMEANCLYIFQFLKLQKLQKIFEGYTHNSLQK